MGQVLDDNMKDDLMQIQKSVSRLNSTKVEEEPIKGDSTKVEEPRKGEKLTSKGPPPGERLVIGIVGSHTHFIRLLLSFTPVVIVLLFLQI